MVFNEDMASDFGYRRKRGGHLFSKMRFLSAQLEAYLDGDLWLNNAAHANEAATRLADGLAALGGVELVHAVEANEVFAKFPQGLSAGLQEDGFAFYDEAVFQTPHVRLVCAFDTREADVDALIAAAARHLAAAT